VEGYPTLLWLPRGSQELDGKKYAGQRKAVNILQFIKDELSALESYARVSELTNLVKKLINGEDADEVLTEAKKFVSSLEDEAVKSNGELYIKYMDKFITKNGNEYVEKEIGRLNKLIDGGMSPAKQMEVERKLSVLTTFTPDSEE